MATETHVVIAWGMVLILVWVIAAILIVVGWLRKNTALRSAGFVLLGLAAFATPFTLYLNKVDTGDILLISVLAFLGGVSAAISVLTYASFLRKRP